MNLDILKNIENESVEVKNYYSFNYDYFNMSPHSHQSAELMYNDGGECEIFIYSNDNKKEHSKVKLKKGQFILISSNIIHRLYVKKERPSKILNLEFGSQISEKTANTTPGFYNFYGIIEKDSGYAVLFDSVEIKAVIKKLLNELTSPHYDTQKLYINTLITEIYILISRCYINSASGSQYYVIKTMDYIKENYSHNITIPDIADAVGLNYIYLERLIKNNTGKTLLTHLNGVRLAQAKKMMENTKLPLTDIAFHCGYGSRQSFYESFVKSEGMSPSVYKKNILQSKYKNYKQTPFFNE